MRDRPWFKALTRGVGACAVVGIIGDLLQPLAPFAMIGITVSTLALLALVLFFRPRLNKHKDMSVRGLVPDMIDPAIVVAIVLLVTSAGLKIWQNYLPEGNERGITGASNDFVRELQDKLSGVEKAVARVERRIDEVKDGLGRTEKGIGTLDKKADVIDTRTQAISQDVKAIQKGSDPVSLARQRILAAQYDLDDAGYIKAVAQGSTVADQFEILGIRGDAASLRQSLLTFPVGTTEFDQLAQFMAKAHSEHYAHGMREEIRGLLRAAQRANSFDPLRKSACSSTDKSLAAEFAKINLGKACRDASEWPPKALKFGQKTAQWLDEDSMPWWVVTAVSLVHPQGYAASIGTVPSKRPTTPRAVSADELIRLVGGRASEDDLVRADVRFVLGRAMLGTGEGVLLFKDGRQPQGVLAADLGRYNGHPCNSSAGLATACTGTVVAQVGTSGHRVQSLDAIKPVGPTVDDFVRQLQADKGRWRSASFFLPAIWGREPQFMTVAAALNSTGDQVFAAYCFTAGASFLAMITSRSSDVRTFLNTIVSNRQIGAAREHTITADRATTRLSGTTLPFGEAMWLVPIKGQYFGFFREGAGSARWNIQGQPMISVPLAGAFEAFSSAVSNTICR